VWGIWKGEPGVSGRIFTSCDSAVRFFIFTWKKRKITDGPKLNIKTSVRDPDPDLLEPPDPDLDPLVRGTDPDPAPDTVLRISYKKKIWKIFFASLKSLKKGVGS
jgi:hypothetical protein